MFRFTTGFRAQNECPKLHANDRCDLDDVEGTLGGIEAWRQYAGYHRRAGLRVVSDQVFQPLEMARTSFVRVLFDLRDLDFLELGICGWEQLFSL